MGESDRRIAGSTTPLDGAKLTRASIVSIPRFSSVRSVASPVGNPSDPASDAEATWMELVPTVTAGRNGIRMGGLRRLARSPRVSIAGALTG